MAPRHLTLASASLALVWQAPALAQDFDPQDAATRAVARACDARAGQQLPRERLAEALALESSTGLPGDDAISTAANPDILLERASDRRLRLAATKSILLEKLATPGTPLAKALEVSPAPPRPDPVTVDWLFASGSSYVLKCGAAKPAKPAEFAALPPASIRKGVADLAKLGDERRAAGSAQVTFDSLRTTNLAGEEKRTRKLVVNAALGIRIAGTEDSYALAYGEYSRSRARIQTSPTPTDPSKNGSADDVDALELGLLGTSRVANAVRFTGRAGVIFDAVTDARYLSGGFSVVPITGGLPNLGVCNLNAYRYLGLGIEAMCSASLEGDIRYVLEKGTASLTAKDAIVAAGPSLGLTLRRSLDANGKPRDGLVGNVTYRYLPVLTGTAPDLDRIEASIAYRWWAKDLGFDLGLTYADGIERKSLADEHRFGFTFGVIF